ncbi:MAG: selenocysteine-specific translation elongation factor [Gaiellaceae bacterium]
MNEAAPTLTVGTAGHVDHGKTALVQALTGTNTDRLAEERARGVSIVLGYALLTLPSGRRLSLVDVPGHERFVRTMVAGATGIDCYLMTVAADDGVMPQTREHAAVLGGLAVRTGVVAITKCDLAEPGRAMAEAALLLPGIPIVTVSARTGAGIERLRASLEEVAVECPMRELDATVPRLHIDRVFTVSGAGIVVTGSLWSGTIARGDRLRVLPGDRAVRVRGVQVHNEVVEQAGSGQRVAVNIAGIGRDAVACGDVLTSRDSVLAPSCALDVALDVPVARGRVQLHHGTRVTPALVVPLADGLHQLRLERPLIALRGDRLLLRSIAPPHTIAGGVVVNPCPRRDGSTEGAARRPHAEPLPERPDRRQRPHHPSAELPLAAAVVEDKLRAAGHEPPADYDLDRSALAALRATGRAVRIGRSMHIHREALEDVERRVRIIIDTEGYLTLGRLRDELRTSRRFARALLEHLDRSRVTIRHPDDTRTSGRT